MTVLQVEEMEEKTPLEAALQRLGGRKFETTLAVVVGLVLFAGLEIVLAPSYVIPSAECDLHLDFTQKGILSSVGFTGMIFSSHLIGYLSDTYGRKTVLSRSCFISACILFASSFSPRFEVLVLLWFINGLFVSGIISPAYVYITEFTVLEQKAKVLLIASAVASLATTYQPGIAWSVLPMESLNFWGYEYQPWRVFIALSSLLPMICCIILSVFPESPKFLMSVGRTEEALRDLKRMFVFNTGLSRDQYKVKALSVDKADEHETTNVTGIVQFLKSLASSTVLLFSPAFLLYTVLGSSLQFGIVGVYNVIMMWVPDVVNKVIEFSNNNPETSATVCMVIDDFRSNVQTHVVSLDGSNSSINTFYNLTMSSPTCTSRINEEVFITNMLIGALQFTVFLCASTLTALVGRKTFIAVNILLASLCAFLLTVVTIPYIIFVCMGAVSVLLGATLPVTMSIVVDLFPTYIRSMGSAMCMVFGRIGVAIGNPLFGYVQQIHCNSAYYGLSAVLAGICCLSLLLPVKKYLE